MDGVSSAAAVGQFTVIAAKVTWELKKFYDGTKIVQDVIDGLMRDVEGLSFVLESMRKTFKHISVDDTSELDSYWNSVNRALRDGIQVLNKLNEILATIDRPGKIWERGQKKIRLESARQQIDTYRQHVQSYRDILHLCLQTVIFWNQMAAKESSNTLMVGLVELQQSVHRNAHQVNEKLDRLGQSTNIRPEEAQIAAMSRLRECVKSVAGIVTTASTVLSPDRESTLLPSEFDFHFPEDKDFRLERWIDAQTTCGAENIASASRPAADVIEFDDSDMESESDSEIEFDINRVILDEVVQLLADGRVADAEKKLIARLAALETRPQPGATAQIKHPYLYREVQLALASLLLAKGDFKTADRRAQAALKGFKRLGDENQELACLQLLAKIAKAKGSDSYYDAYTKLCVKLETTMSSSSPGPTPVQLLTTLHARPQQREMCEDDGCTKPTATAEYSSHSVSVHAPYQTLKPATSMATFGPISEVASGVYEDAQEYPAIDRNIESNSVDRTSSEYNSTRIAPIMSPRKQFTMSSFDSNHASTPITQPSPRSSIDMQSDDSTADTSPTDLSSNIAPSPPLNTRHQYISDDGIAYPRPMSVAETATPSTVLATPGKTSGMSRIDLTNPTLSINTIVDSSGEAMTSVRSNQGKARKTSVEGPGGAWSRSGVCNRPKKVSDDPSLSKKMSLGSNFIRKIYSKANDVGDVSKRAVEGPPQLLEIPSTHSPTESSIEKNWVKIETGAQVLTPPTSATVSRKRKAVFVGSSGVGKTSIIARHRHGLAWQDMPGQRRTTKALPTTRQDRPTLSAPYIKIITNPRDGEALAMEISDTPGQINGYELCRHPSYLGANVILACFAIDDRDSLESIERTWHPELQARCPNVPVILVSCKSDLNQKGTITAGEAEVVRHRIGALIYLECSAISGQGINELIECAAVTSCAFDGKKAKMRQNSGTKAGVQEKEAGVGGGDDDETIRAFPISTTLGRHNLLTL